MHSRMLAALVAVALFTTPALVPAAQAAPDKTGPIKIGFISTFSGPLGGLGKDMRDGFLLAIKEDGGKFGGRPVDLIVRDAQGKPDIGRQDALELIQSDHVQLMTGIALSNVLLGTIQPVLKAGIPYVSNNAAPSQLAGKNCKPLFFSGSHQNDTLFEAVGLLMNQDKVPDAYIIAPNFPAGRDMLNGFKRTYKGKIDKEVYTAFPQMDFSGQIAQIRALHPSSVMFFMPGGMTINFIKQYRAAGINIPLYTAQGGVDALTLPALGKLAVGIHETSNWSPELDNPASKKFVADFEATYHRPPSGYAAISYDTARLIAAALASIHGQVEDVPAFRKAMMDVKFNSIRGHFKFNTNQFPIQWFYRIDFVSNGHGGAMEKYMGVMKKNLKDSYAPACHLPPA